MGHDGRRYTLTRYMSSLESTESTDSTESTREPMRRPSPAPTRRRLLTLAVLPLAAAACGSQENLDELPKTGLSEGKVIYTTWGTTQRRETENWTLLAFEKNYTDLKVDVVWSATAQEHVAKQISLLSGGTPPDVMRLPAWAAPTFYNEDAARRLDAYFRRDGFKTDNLAAPYDVATFKRG